MVALKSIQKQSSDNILLGRWSTITSENNKVTEKWFFYKDSANKDHWMEVNYVMKF